MGKSTCHDIAVARTLVALDANALDEWNATHIITAVWLLSHGIFYRFDHQLTYLYLCRHMFQAGPKVFISYS